jgi:D-alanyl-D-alanine dipeptidase
MLLVETMLSVGFSNCRDEWWHYSYGDAGWAVRMDRPVCFYGLIQLDESLYREQEALWIEAAKDRANPFLS